MEIYAEIVSFGDLKLRNFSLWGWRRKLPRKRFEMGTVFHHSPRGDSVPENY
jgi:hypothetical protein